MTFIVVTHNPALAGMMNRRVELRSGELYAH
jgi:lipoprotein-releasing system ATP-binding protein